MPSLDSLVMDDFMNDALAAAEFLQGRDEVQSESVVVVGHSQSAVFVPIMLQAMPSLQSGAMLEGAYKPIDEVLVYQREYTFEQLEAVGMTPSQALEEIPAVQQLNEMAEGVQAVRAGSDEPTGGVSAMFWRSWFNATDNAIAAAANNSQEMLLLQGELDTTAPPSEAQAWANYLDLVDAEYQLQILPCVTHALNCLSQSDFTLLTPEDIGKHVDPKVIETLAAFIFKNLNVTAGPLPTNPPNTLSPTTTSSSPSGAQILVHHSGTIAVALLLVLLS